mmetsp:Transcript_35846/g.54963  ORF Transcript_35846/g.54963 Transcript_35846/m.54963 type:complete len:120 (+) Transcript_35846:1613-1972(+)
MEENLSLEKDPDLPHFMRSLIGWDPSLQAKATRIVKVVKDKFIDSRKFETLVHQTVPNAPVYKQYGKIKQVTLTMENFRRKVKELFYENDPSASRPSPPKKKEVPAHMIKEEGRTMTTL